jgi:small subunit ribosomal protein S17
MTNDTKETIKRKFQGEVVSDVEDKTVRVKIKRMKQHPKYKKRYDVSKKYAVHDEENIAEEGDTVVFEECRPISKTKKWRLIKVLEE